MIFSVLVSLLSLLVSCTTIPDIELSALKDTLVMEGGNMFVALDAEYRNYSKPYAIQCDNESPKAVFLPKTEDGLKATLLAIIKYKAEFVVTVMRLNQDCLSSTTGYMINMRLFNKMEMERTNSRIRLGAGIYGDEVNVFVQEKGNYYVNNLVCTWHGMVGPIFGGGFSWHLNYAFDGHMADNVIEFRFMDYKGDVYYVDEKNKPDLFWSLRGGGGQLGIVTEVVMNVHLRKSTFNMKTYKLPCAMNCSTAESVTDHMEQVGQFYNTLPDNVGVFNLASAAIINVLCDWCDIESLVLSHFPDAVVVEAWKDYDKRRGDVSDAFKYIRHFPVINGFWGQPYDNASVPMTWDNTMARYPIMDVSMGAWIFERHSSEITKIWKTVMNNEAVFTGSAIWSSFLGKTLINDIDSAASNHKGSRVTWNCGNFVGDQDFYHDLNKGFANVPETKAVYWNYKNKYTSEEFAFTYNLKRVKEIRNKYDPEGYFTLPARKNQGSKLLDYCIPAYHCSNNGKLEESSRDGIPTDGCKCKCDDGWTGEMCDVVDGGKNHDEVMSQLNAILNKSICQEELADGGKNHDEVMSQLNAILNKSISQEELADGGKKHDEVMSYLYVNFILLVLLVTGVSVCCCCHWNYGRMPTTQSTQQPDGQLQA